MVVLASNLITAGSIIDGDRGDITVSGSGGTWTIDNGAVTTPKLATLVPGVIISGSSADDALRITQTGTGNALVVEDENNPDATRFVVSAAGDVGIGIAPGNVGAGYTNLRIGNTNGGVLDFLSAGVGQGRIFNSTTSFIIESGYVAGGATAPLVFRTNQSTERFRIADNGAWGLAGNNYGTAGQVITSTGASSAPTWQTPSAGGGSAGQSIILSMIFGR